MAKRELTKTYHIIFDAFGIPKHLLSSEKFVFELLMDIPKLLGMKILAGPTLVRDYDTGHEGVTGFAIVDFSHVSIHTFADSREIFVDVFSCKDFEPDTIRAYLYRKLKAQPSQVATVEVKYPWEK